MLLSQNLGRVFQLPRFHMCERLLGGFVNFKLFIQKLSIFHSHFLLVNLTSKDPNTIFWERLISLIKISDVTIWDDLASASEKIRR